MKKAIKYIYDANPFYVHLKKHYCPQCGERLGLKYVSKIVNSKSPEAKNHDFSVGDTFFVGGVELSSVTWFTLCVGTWFTVFSSYGSVL